MCIIPYLLSGMIFINGQLNPYLLDAIAFVESSYNISAVSHKGAFGIFQITNIACRDVGIKCNGINTPMRYQIEVVNRFIKKYYTKTGDICRTLDIYNRGIGNVKSKPFKGRYEAHRYVGKIIAYLKFLLKGGIIAKKIIYDKDKYIVVR